MTDLFPYQVEGARFLATRKRALLADEMGLGKSAQAIVACDLVGADEVLVVCPASVRENWRREFKKFGRRQPEAVWSYDNATKSVADGVRPEVDVLILDEAHYLKSRTAKRTKAIFGEKCDGVGGLVERAEHVFMLTGTPTPNNPSELWPMLRAVLPEAIAAWKPIPFSSLKPLAYWPFVQRYCRTRDNGFGIEIVGGKNLPEIRERIAPYVLRRKKEEVLKDLPEIRFDQLYLDSDFVMPTDATPLLRKVEAALAEHGVDGLAKIASHVATLRRLTGLAKANPAIDWIRDQVEGGLEKLVVFAHHREVMSAIAVGLSMKEIGYAWLDGSTKDRQGEVDRFQTDPDCRVFLGQLQAAGTGITLTAASDVLFVESSWVPAENEQAAMRVHRIGQRNACLVRFATLAGSIDEKIQRAVLRKTADIVKLFG